MPEKYTPTVRERLEAARYVLAEDYVRALAVRDALARDVDQVLSRADVLALPTLAIPAPEIGATSVRIGSKEEPIRPLMLRLTQLFNLTGHPCVSLPCGVTGHGLPCGLQLVGVRNQTDTLLRIALGGERIVAGG
jgi:aspartyl-tRNA(Asn)/glutamyl-tRNA(Gln) amidotransferase subunit A